MMLQKLLAMYSAARDSLSPRGRLAALACMPVVGAALLIALWALVTRRWALLLFVCYVAAALVVLIQSVVGDDASKQMPISLDAFTEEFSLDKGKLQLWLFWIRTWGAAASAALSWPSTVALLLHALYKVLLSMRTRGYITLQDRVRLGADLDFATQYFFSALATCVSTLVAFECFQLLHVRSRYALLLMLSFVLAVMVRQTVSLFFKGGVLGLFKKTEGIPVLRFVAVLLFDLTTIVLAIASAHAMRHQQTVRASDIQNTAIMLVTLNTVVTKAVGGGVHHALEYIHSLSQAQLGSIAIGLVTYVVLLRTTTSLLSLYQRDDDDHIAVATTLILKGQFDKAESHLVQVVRHTPLSQHLRVRTLLSLQNLAKAEECTIDALKSDFSNKELVGVNEVYFSMLVDSFGVSAEAKLGWWKTAVERDVSGAILFLMLLENDGDRTFIDSVFNYGNFASTALPLGSYCAIGLSSAKDAVSWLNLGCPLRREEQFLFSAVYLITEVLSNSRAEWESLVEDWFHHSFDHFTRIHAELAVTTSFWKCFTSLVVSSHLSTIMKVIGSGRAAEIDVLIEKSKLQMSGNARGRALSKAFLKKMSETPPWRVVPIPPADTSAAPVGA